MKLETMSILSWNVNGMRAVHRKGFLKWFNATQPDILCVQESRAEAHQLPAAVAQPPGYHGYWNASRRKKGYSGTGLLSREAPLDVQFGLGIDTFDQEGRTIIAQYPTFTLINCYFPNGGRDQKRVPFKMAFYEAFLNKCQQLRQAGQRIIFCGDVNTAHRPIDLARPKANIKHTGFLPKERAWIDNVIETGYVDTFRHFHPKAKGHYTWWSVPTRARERNVGWRLDYVFVVQELLDRINAAFILPDVMGSDHCPVGITLQRE